MTQHTPNDADALELLVGALPPQTPGPEARDNLLRELRGPERWTPWAASVAALIGVALPDSLQALQLLEDDSAWRGGLWPGSRILQTPAFSAAQALIARLPPATCIASHAHAQRELTYVLAGELLEASADGRCSYGPGELVDKQAGSEHELTVAGTTDCLVVFFVRSA